MCLKRSGPSIESRICLLVCATDPSARKVGMSLFHKLHDVYFDAVKLWEELERIPRACDCGDAHAHLSRQCCCAGLPPQRAETGTEGSGCLARLEALGNSIGWFREDMRKEIRELEPGEASCGLGSRLFLIENLIDSLNSSVDRIKLDLMAFRATCAHDALQRMKGSSEELRRYIDKLNDVI